MSEVTRILAKLQDGDTGAAAQLLPLVYDELRNLAAVQMAQERPGHTLQATALVHEAYLRLVKPDQARRWEGCAHFYLAAAEAMRRILVDNARRKSRQKRGGDWKRRVIALDEIAQEDCDEELLFVDLALSKLEAINQSAAELVKLRYFAGYTIPEVAEKIGISPRKADQIWAYAKSWLLDSICDNDA